MSVEPGAGVVGEDCGARGAYGGDGQAAEGANAAEMAELEDVRIRDCRPVLSPLELKRRHPAADAVRATVLRARDAIRAVFNGEDDRLIVVAGPCSIHDVAAALDYADRLAAVARQTADRLLVLMRTYFEKPRTTVGWRGFLNDPHLDGSFDMEEGLTQARDLLLAVTAKGLPCATEMLDPISPQYIADVIALGAIGARTAESQTHRALASGVSMPVGFKNATSGDVQVAVDGLVSAREEHSFFGIDQAGRSCVVHTAGNPDGALVLRGGRARSNYDADSIAAARRAMEAAGLPPRILVDCSHANSGYDHRRQPEVWRAVLAQRAAGQSAIQGLMVESNIEAGRQDIRAGRASLRYGVSVTDACMDWATTEQLLAQAYGR